MADPLLGFAAVSAVSSILQLLEFATKFTRETYSFVKSAQDALPENLGLERLIHEYGAVSAAVTDDIDSLKALTPKEEAVLRTAADCQTRAKDLLDLLDTLKADTAHRGVKRAFHGGVKVWKSMKKKKELEEAHSALDESNRLLTTQLLQLLRHDLGTSNGEILAEIRQSAENVERRLIDQSETILKALQKAHDRRAYRITKSLWFPDLLARRDAIASAHQETFEWVFSRSDSELLQWLHTGTGLFWVCGKAGSGKSTFMKFVRGHRLTPWALRAWCGQSKLVILDFYFWYAGTSTQKSVQGLLRSILHQIFQQYPGLTREACASRWELATRDENRDIPPWTEDDLFAAFRLVLDARWSDSQHPPNADPRVQLSPASNSITSNGSPKFCLFIDGLDEYAGDHIKLTSYLKDLSLNRRFKICVSSRPWNVFTGAFGGLTTKMELERFTRPDISRYVREIVSSALCIVHNHQDGGRLSQCHYDIMDAITSKAQGVFLWVYLVVQSVIRGFSEGDSEDFLLQRVERFPEDLEEFFSHILERVEPIYARSTAQALLLAERIVNEQDDGDNNSSSFLTYWLLRAGQLGLEPAPKSQLLSWSTLQLDGMLSDTRKFLSACCKDLVYLDTTESPSAPSFARCISQTKARFSHRTVYDFLKTDRLVQMTTRHRSPSFEHADFLQSLSLARLSFVLTFSDIAGKVTEVRDFFSSETRHVCESLQIFNLPDLVQMELARDLDKISHAYAKAGLLGGVSSDGCQNVSARAIERIFWNDSGSLHCSLADYRMPLYLRASLQRPHDMLVHAVSDLSQNGLLAAALGIISLRPCIPDYLDVELLALLLQHKFERVKWHKVEGVKQHKLRQLWAGPWTVWQLFLADWLDICRRIPGDSIWVAPENGLLLFDMIDPRSSGAWKIARLLLQHGADIDAVITLANGTQLHVKQVLRECLPSEYHAEIAEILASMRALKRTNRG